LLADDPTPPGAVLWGTGGVYRYVTNIGVTT
jgi:hypothetical protein